MKQETASEENERHNARVVAAKKAMAVWEAMHPDLDEDTEEWKWALALVSMLVIGEGQRA